MNDLFLEDCISFIPQLFPGKIRMWNILDSLHPSYRIFGKEIKRAVINGVINTVIQPMKRNTNRAPLKNTFIPHFNFYDVVSNCFKGYQIMPSFLFSETLRYVTLSFEKSFNFRFAGTNLGPIFWKKQIFTKLIRRNQFNNANRFLHFFRIIFC